MQVRGFTAYYYDPKGLEKEPMGAGAAFHRLRTPLRTRRYSSDRCFFDSRSRFSTFGCGSERLSLSANIVGS